MTDPLKHLKQDAQSLPDSSTVKQFTDDYSAQTKEAANTLRSIQAAERGMKP